MRVFLKDIIIRNGGKEQWLAVSLSHDLWFTPPSLLSTRLPGPVHLPVKTCLGIFVRLPRCILQPFPLWGHTNCPDCWTPFPKSSLTSLLTLLFWDASPPPPWSRGLLSIFREKVLPFSQCSPKSITFILQFQMLVRPQGCWGISNFVYHQVADLLDEWAYISVLRSIFISFLRIILSLIRKATANQSIYYRWWVCFMIKKSWCLYLKFLEMCSHLTSLSHEETLCSQRAL